MQVANEIPIQLIGDNEPQKKFDRVLASGFASFKGGLAGVYQGGAPAGLCRPLLSIPTTDGTAGATGLSSAGVFFTTAASGYVSIQRGCFEFAMGSGADAFTDANWGAPLYAIDDQTLGLTDGDGTRPLVGVCWGVNLNTGFGRVYIAPDDDSDDIVIVRSRSLSFAAGDFTAAATSQVYSVGFPLPAACRLLFAETYLPTGGKLHGGGSSAVNLELGYGGAPTQLLATTDVWTADGLKTNGAAATYPGDSQFGGQQLLAKLVVTGANVTALTQGLVTVHAYFVRI